MYSRTKSPLFWLISILQYHLMAITVFFCYLRHDKYIYSLITSQSTALLDSQKASWVHDHSIYCCLVCTPDRVHHIKFSSNCDRIQDFCIFLSCAYCIGSGMADIQDSIDKWPAQWVWISVGFLQVIAICSAGIISWLPS